MNENQIIKEIVKQVIEEYGIVKWNEVSSRLFKLYRINKSAEACRSSYRRNVELGDYKNNTKIVNEIKKDGTQISDRIIAMSEENSKSKEFIIKAHGYSVDEFELVSVKNTIWQVDSKKGEMNNYHSQITVKPKTENDLTKNDIIEVLNEINISKKYDVDVKLKTYNENDLALEIDFADVHIGSFSWHEEVGEDNDYKITFKKIYEQVAKAKRIIDKENVGKLYLCFLGDFLHVDTESGTTTKGTVVDMDSRPKKMVAKGLEILMYIIDNLAVTDTEVIWIEGNHSRLVEYTLFQSLPYIYANAKHIKFDVSPRIRKAFVFGENLIGLHHGEMNKNEMFNWLQIEYREYWGKVSYAEQHSGHTHQEKVVEKGGIIQRTNPTSKSIDLYEYQNGWNSEKTSIAYLWHKKEKLLSTHYLR